MAVDSNGTKYLAHSPSDTGHEDLLHSHLQEVATRAAQYAAPLGIADEAYITGLLHDLGKYGKRFQQRIKGKDRGIDHWSAGAWTALTKYELQGIAAALAVQGHHVGLQEATPDALQGLDPSKLMENHPQGLKLSEPDIATLLSHFNAEGLSLPDDAARSVYDWRAAPRAAGMLDVRMLFSCLVDADYIETEAHFQAASKQAKSYRAPGPVLEAGRDLSVLLDYLDNLARRVNVPDHVKQVRSDLLAACLQAADSPQGLFTLTAPTGAGKTLSMLAFALKHAARHKLRRIVVVIPYLSIIEQTVHEYRKALAPVIKKHGNYVLEHHSLATASNIEPDQEDTTKFQERLLAENWDAPIIVTTSVQFLESLFANRPAACRKLHRLAQSVILFDEVQTLKSSLAVPTLATLARLAERYQSTVVFSTATQPAFSHLHELVTRYCAYGWQPQEIVPRDLRLFERAKRTVVQWPPSGAVTSWAELSEAIAAHQQVLCIVNLKRHALALLEELQARASEGLLHLSTNMCPAHRRVVLEDIRKRLAGDEPCRLVSTQCVEAGVDVDFPTVFRAFGPLDAIAQAAGRCNRNGRAQLGTVHLFVPEDEEDKRLYPDSAYQQAAAVTRILLEKHHPEGMNIDDPYLFEEYYKLLYSFHDMDDKRDNLLAAIKRRSFVDVARYYRVIDKDAINVLVPYDVKAYEALAEEVRTTGLTRQWIIKARAHAVSLYRPRNDPVEAYLEPVRVGKGGNQSQDWFVYLAKEHYDPLLGLVPPSSTECLIA